MIRSTRRALATVIVLGATIVAADPGLPGFHPVPAVVVVHTSSPVGAMGLTMLQNDEADPAMVGSITRAASCDPEVTATVPTGPPFDVLAGTSVAMTVHCNGAPMTGMKRCLFSVNDKVGDSYFEVEGVCEYGQMPSLGPSVGAINFGNVMVGDTASQQMSVHNNSPTSITGLFFQTTDIDGNFKIGAPCNPDARECDAPISPVGQGSDASFVVKCTPQTIGMHTAQVYVASNTNQYAMPPVAVTCTGVSSGNPVLSVTGNPIDAGDVEVIGGLGSGAVHLRNAGAGTLQITSVMITGTTASDWSYSTAGQCVGTGIPPACNLTTNQEVDVNVTFDPSAIGTRDASLLIQYFDTASRSLSVPLRGMGRGATLELVGGLTTIDFGLVPVNVTSQVTFQLANQGNRDLLDATLGVAAPAGPFALSPSMTAVVSAGGMTTITASCHPTGTGTFATTFTASAPDAFMSPPISIPATCQGTNMTVFSNPTTLALGELRTGTTPGPISIMVLGTTPVTVTGYALETPSSQLVLTGPTGTTPLALQLAVTPSTDGDLANAILVTSNSGNLRIPISGKVVTATFNVPPTTSLGTFCINASTTGVPLSLTSTGTAALRLTAPRMDSPTSPFDLGFASPSAYPATVTAGGLATVTVTPKRQAIAGERHDELVWSTDVAGMLEARTSVSATFLSAGGAIAPSVLAFGKVPIHLDRMNGQSVTLQNCDSIPIVLDDVHLDAPFTLDSTSFPKNLAPSETATVSIGFHPTKLGFYTQTLSITSMQLAAPLEIALSGEGITGSGDGDGGVGNGLDPKSFYGCSGCSTREPAGGVVVMLACGAVMVRRRRRRSPGR